MASDTAREIMSKAKWLEMKDLAKHSVYGDRDVELFPNRSSQQSQINYVRGLLLKSKNLPEELVDDIMKMLIKKKKPLFRSRTNPMVRGSGKTKKRKKTKKSTKKKGSKKKRPKKKRST
jgi:hypothetical protein